MIIWAEIQSKSVEQSKWPNISQKLLPAPTKLSRRWPWLEMRGIIQRSDGWWWWGPTLARGGNLIMVEDRLLDYCLTAGTTKPTNTSAFLCFRETLCILHGRWTGSSESGVRGESRQTPWRPSNPTCPPYHPAHSFWGEYIGSRKGTKIHVLKYSNPDARDGIILCQRQLGIGIPAQQRITFVRCQTALTRFHALLPLYGS